MKIGGQAMQKKINNATNKFILVLFMVLLLGCSVNNTPEQNIAIKENANEPEKRETDCNSVPDLDKSVCLWNLAVKNNNEKICNQIEEFEHQNRCYSEIAEIKKDPNICKIIKGKNIYSGSYHCFMRVATALKDSSICENIEDRGLIDWCLNLVGKGLKDVAICDKISDASIIEECKNYIKIMNSAS